MLGWSASPAPGRALPGAAVWDAGTRDVGMQDSGMQNEGCGMQGFELKMRNVEMDGGCRMQSRPRFPQGWRPRGRKSCRSLCPCPVASAHGSAGARDLGSLRCVLTVISPLWLFPRRLLGGREGGHRFAPARTSPAAGQTDRQEDAVVLARGRVGRVAGIPRVEAASGRGG